MKKIILIILLAVVLFVALRKDQQSSKTIKLGNSLQNLIFQSQADAKRMQTLNSCIQTFFPSGWQYHDNYEEVGAFYEASWCNGSGCKYPNGSNAQGKRDTQRITLSTTKYKLPQVYGVALAVDYIPNQAGWGINFSFANGMASTVTNNRFHINFLQFDNLEGKEVEKVYVGSGDSYKIYETEIAVTSPNVLEDDLITVTSSAQSMRDTTLNQLKNLRQKVASTIASDTITRCSKTEQIRSNLPPRCIQRSKLTEKEKTEELQKANTYFDAQEKLLNTYYQQLYDVLIKSVPLKNCLYSL